MGFDSSTWHGAAYGAIGREAELRNFARSGGFGNANRTDTSANIIFSAYRNQKLGFGIQYPSNWDVEDKGKTIAFTSPLEHEYDKFREGIGVSIYEPTNRPIEVIAELYLSFVKKFYQQDHPIVGTYIRRSNIAEYPAAEIHYMLINDPNEERRVHVTEVGGRCVIIEFKAYDFHKYLPIADRMTSTFTLI